MSIWLRGNGVPDPDCPALEISTSADAVDGTAARAAKKSAGSTASAARVRVGEGGEAAGPAPLPRSPGRREGGEDERVARTPDAGRGSARLGSARLGSARLGSARLIIASVAPVIVPAAPVPVPLPPLETEVTASSHPGSIMIALSRSACRAWNPAPLRGWADTIHAVRIRYEIIFHIVLQQYSLVAQDMSGPRTRRDGLQSRDWKESGAGAETGPAAVTLHVRHPVPASQGTGPER